MLYDKQGKYKEAKDILSDSPNESGQIKEARKKMEWESSQPDWYRWWFSHSIAKKAVGLFLIAAILLPLASISVVIFNYYLISKDVVLRSHLTDFLSKNAAVIVGLLTVLIGMAVAKGSLRLN